MCVELVGEKGGEKKATMMLNTAEHFASQVDKHRSKRM